MGLGRGGGLHLARSSWEGQNRRMKTDGGLTSKVHVAGHAIMRRLPALRQQVRKVYYAMQQKR